MEQVMTNEKRFLSPEVSEIRADAKTGTISGYAMVFNSRSVLLFGQFYERILPEAVDGVIEKSDVLALLDHDRSRGILSRSVKGKGTLSLTVDDKGLRYEFTPPETALAKEVSEYLKRGEINSSSFEFRLADGGDHQFAARHARRRAAGYGASCRLLQHIPAIRRTGAGGGGTQRIPSARKRARKSS